MLRKCYKITVLRGNFYFAKHNAFYRAHFLCSENATKLLCCAVIFTLLSTAIFTMHIFCAPKMLQNYCAAR